MNKYLGLFCLLISVAGHSTTCSGTPLNNPPTYTIVNGKVSPVLTLQGQSGFVFTMYGIPSYGNTVTDTLDHFKNLISCMIENNLGNGFDTGPSPLGGSSTPDCSKYTCYYDYLATIGWPMMWNIGANMQVDAPADSGCSAVLTSAQVGYVQPMVEKNCFVGVHLDEWGYYFHNLSDDCSWWVGNYCSGCSSGGNPCVCTTAPGCTSCAPYNACSAYMAPEGQAGYQVPYTELTPAYCYTVLQSYFANRESQLTHSDSLGLISMTSHSHYEAYAGEWGASVIGIEIGNNIAFTQSKVAFARAASLQWQVPWSAQISPWFNDCLTYWQPDCLATGHSSSLINRMWLYTWFTGAAMVTPENSINIFFNYDSPTSTWFELTEYGTLASNFFQFTKAHDRGSPYIPVAIVMDHLTGYNGYMGSQWGNIGGVGTVPSSQPYQQIRDLFDFQLYPDSDYIWYATGGSCICSCETWPDCTCPTFFGCPCKVYGKCYLPDSPTCGNNTQNTTNYETRFLVPTPFGDIYNIHLSNVSSAVLNSYQTILLVGKFSDFTACNFIETLGTALANGSNLLISQAQQTDLEATPYSSTNAYEYLCQQGSVEVLQPWTNPATGRPTAISSNTSVAPNMTTNRLGLLAQQSIPFAITGSDVQYTVNTNSAGYVIQLINNAGVYKCASSPAYTDDSKVATVQITTTLSATQATEWVSGTVHSDASSFTVSIPSGGVEFVQYYVPVPTPTPTPTPSSPGIYNLTRFTQINDVGISNAQTKLIQAGL